VVNVEVYRISSNVLAGDPREIVTHRCMAAAEASDIKNGQRSIDASNDSPSGHLLGGIADERVGLFESGVMRRIALKLGIQTLGFGARRFLAAEHPGIRRSVALDCDGGSSGLARIARES
jgi:hypothetical protein